MTAAPGLLRGLSASVCSPAASSTVPTVSCTSCWKWPVSITVNGSVAPATSTSTVAPPEPEPMEPEGDATRSNLDYLREVVRDANASSREVQRAAARYRPRVEYGNDELARALAAAAALIDARLGAEVISVELSGFDTHNGQLARHAEQLGRLDGALGAFLDDLEGHPGAADMLVLVFSEFGRRAAENGSGGTDHGTAGPVLLAGPRAKPGLHAPYPNLEELDERGDLLFNTDFRRVYAAVARDLFGVDAEAVVGPGFAPLRCLTA